MFGTTYSSDSRSASGVQIDAQKRLDDKYGKGKFLVTVEDFTDTHFKINVERHLDDPSMVNSLCADMLLEADKSFLWPDLHRIPFGWLYVVSEPSEGIKDELNQLRKEQQCSKISNLSITTTPTNVVVEIWKEQNSI